MPGCTSCSTNAIAQGKLTEADVRSRIQEIGPIEFEEIRAVLRQEEYLLPPRTDLAVYVEFAAVYLELRYFVPEFLRSYFPSMSGLSSDRRVAGARCRRRSACWRPPAARRARSLILAEVPSRGTRSIGSTMRSRWLARPACRPESVRIATAEALMARAEHVARPGNLVRAAILRTRAARAARTDLSVSLREQARGDIAAAGRATASRAELQRQGSRRVDPLAACAAGAGVGGIWTTEARVLYDLQKVCVDHERGVYTLDVFGWAVFAGPQATQAISAWPARRADVEAPAQRARGVCRPRGCRIAGAAGWRRCCKRPCIGRKPTCGPASSRSSTGRSTKSSCCRQIRRNKSPARSSSTRFSTGSSSEGFLSMGDLRDALSRNNLKLPDLASAKQFFRGDQLIRADRQLATTLDGVYRGGEVYLRFPQRLELAGLRHAAGPISDAVRGDSFWRRVSDSGRPEHLVNPLLARAGRRPEEVHLINPVLAGSSGDCCCWD